MTDQEKIIAALKRVTRKDTVPATDEPLFDSGYLDSFALPDMVAEIEKEFSITIPDSDLTPRKFESIDRIATYIESKR